MILDGVMLPNLPIRHSLQYPLVGLCFALKRSFANAYGIHPYIHTAVSISVISCISTGTIYIGRILYSAGEIGWQVPARCIIYRGNLDFIVDGRLQQCYTYACSQLAHPSTATSQIPNPRVERSWMQNCKNAAVKDHQTKDCGNESKLGRLASRTIETWSGREASFSF